MSETRANWDEIWVDVCLVMSKRSTCLRAHTGAVLVSNENQVISTGYNGAPRGVEHCFTAGCEIVENHCIRSLHAEANALMGSSNFWTKGSTLYCTHRPCQMCAKLAIQKKVARIVYINEYDSDEALAFVKSILNVSGIRLDRYDLKTRESHPAAVEQPKSVVQQPVVAAAVQPLEKK